jgi:hypothetical protein
MASLEDPKMQPGNFTDMSASGVDETPPFPHMAARAAPPLWISLSNWVVVLPCNSQYAVGPLWSRPPTVQFCYFPVQLVAVLPHPNQPYARLATQKKSSFPAWQYKSEALSLPGTCITNPRTPGYAERSKRIVLLLRLEVACLHLELLVVATIGGVPKQAIVSKLCHYLKIRYIFIRGLLEELLNQVNVGHKHATAAVTLASQAVHGLAIPIN